MKIYEPNHNNEADSTYDFVESLLDNDLNVEDKMINLSNSFEQLKLTPGAIDKLIEYLFKRFDIPVTFSRKGDNNERFDAKITINNCVGLVEIEVPSIAMLDVPRNLLDNIAVEVNRNKNEIDNIIPIAICWTFPNNRSDYWNVVHDINNILNIKIKTLSILSLAVYYWTGNNLDLKGDSFYVDVDNTELKPLFNILHENNIDQTKFNGFFSPFK